MRFPLPIITLLAFSIATTAFSESRALLVGVGRYQDSRIRALPGIDKDLELMRQFAVKLGYRESLIKTLWNEQATLENIRSALRTHLVAGVGPQDKVLIYFSSHGSQIRDQAPMDEADGKDEVLVTYDASTVNGLSNVLVDDELSTLLASIPSMQVTVILDSCHSGTATKSMAVLLNRSRGDYDGGSFEPKFYSYSELDSLPIAKAGVADSSFLSKVGPTRSNFFGLSAARDDQFAQATPDGSLFTKALVEEAMRVPTDQPITGRRVFAGGAQGTASYISRAPQKISQDPVTSGSSEIGELDMRVGIRMDSNGEELFKKWSGVVLQSGAPVIVEANQTQFRPGERLTLSFRAPMKGFVHVIYIAEGRSKATLLYPNQWQTENAVEAGQVISLPNPGVLYPAAIPAGLTKQKNMIVVLISPKSRNVFRDGVTEAALKTLTESETAALARNFALEADYAAGKVEVWIQR